MIPKNIPPYLIECVYLLGGRKNVTSCYRYETGDFMGMFLTDGEQFYLPADKTRREIIKILNRYLIDNELQCIIEDTVLL